MQMNIKKYRYIDYFKALAMILVVLGHINFANEEIKAWIYAFHMPAFFFASGMVINPKKTLNIKEGAKYAWKKIQSLVFPYFLWGLIYSSLELKNIFNIFYGSHYSLSVAGSLTSLWFLPVLFVATVFSILFSVVLKVHFNFIIKIILIMIALVAAYLMPTIERGYPWGINVAFAAFVFLLLGNILHPVIIKLYNAVLDKKFTIILTVSISCVAFIGTLLYKLNIPDRGYIMMANADYGNFPVFVVVASFGTVFLLTLSLLMDIVIKKAKIDRIFSFIGCNTLVIFAVQKPIIKVFSKLFSIINIYNPIALIMTCIGTIIISCIMALFFNKYVPVLTGHIQSALS